MKKAISLFGLHSVYWRSICYTTNMRKQATDNLHKIGIVSWPKLFRAWERREATSAGWIRLYRSRGFSSWREWRMTACKDLHPERRKWILYKVEHPEIVVPTWFGGPFRGWRKHYRGRAVTFKTLVSRRSIRAHTYVLGLEKSFPRTTQLLGVRQKGKIVVIEGMHRACAVALAAQSRKKLRTSLTLALTPLSGKLPNLSAGQNR